MGQLTLNLDSKEEKKQILKKKLALELGLTLQETKNHTILDLLYIIECVDGTPSVYESEALELINLD